MPAARAAICRRPVPSLGKRLPETEEKGTPCPKSASSTLPARRLARPAPGLMNLYSHGLGSALSGFEQLWDGIAD